MFRHIIHKLNDSSQDSPLSGNTEFLSGIQITNILLKAHHFINDSIQQYELV